jgi:hypothetical protein
VKKERKRERKKRKERVCEKVKREKVGVKGEKEERRE